MAFGLQSKRQNIGFKTIAIKLNRIVKVLVWPSGKIAALDLR